MSVTQSSMYRGFAHAMQAQGIDPSQPVPQDRMMEVLDLLNDAIQTSARYSSQMNSQFSRERIAGLRAEVDVAKTLTDLYKNLEGIRSDDRQAALKATTDTHVALIRAQETLSQKASGYNERAVQAMSLAYRTASGGQAGAAAAWDALAGILNEPGMYMSPAQMNATIREMHSLAPDFIDLPKYLAGDFNGALGPAGSAMVPQVRAGAIQHLQRGHAAGTQINASLSAITTAQNQVAATAQGLQSGTVDPTQARTAAMNAIQSVRTAAPNLLNPTDAAADLAAYESADASAQAVQRQIARLEAMLGNDSPIPQDPRMAAIFANPAFQQWAQDRGYKRIGFVTEDGTYIRGVGDLAAIMDFRREVRRPEKYQRVFAPAETGDLVRVTLGPADARAPLRVAGQLNGRTVVYNSGTGTFHYADDGSVLEVPEGARAVLVEKAQQGQALVANGQFATLAEVTGEGTVDAVEASSPEFTAAEAASVAAESFIAPRLRTDARDLIERGNVVAYVKPDGTVGYANPDQVEVINRDDSTMRSDRLNVRRGEAAAEARSTQAGPTVPGGVNDPNTMYVEPGGPTAYDRQIEAESAQAIESAVPPADRRRSERSQVGTEVAARPPGAVDAAGADLPEDEEPAARLTRLYGDLKATTQALRDAATALRDARGTPQEDAARRAYQAAYHNMRAARSQMPAGSELPDAPTSVSLGLGDTDSRIVPNPASDARLGAILGSHPGPDGEARSPDRVAVVGQFMVRHNPRTLQTTVFRLPASAAAPAGTVYTDQDAHAYIAGLAPNVLNGVSQVTNPPSAAVERLLDMTQIRPAQIDIKLPERADTSDADTSEPAPAPARDVSVRRVTETGADGEEVEAVVVHDTRTDEMRMLRLPRRKDGAPRDVRRAIADALGSGARPDVVSGEQARRADPVVARTFPKPSRSKSRVSLGSNADSVEIDVLAPLVPTTAPERRVSLGSNPASAGIDEPAPSIAPGSTWTPIDEPVATGQPSNTLPEQAGKRQRLAALAQRIFRGDK